MALRAPPGSLELAQERVPVVGGPGPALAEELPGPLALLPTYERGTEAYAECEGVLGSMRVALALRRYKADRGQAASRLKDLVPDYISQIPPDPFTGGELLLKRDGALLAVYSVGADLKDDGGKVMRDPKHRDPPDTGVRIRE